MSGMFETKTDKASRKLELNKKEEKAKRKSRIIAVSIISALILVSALAIIFNSNFIRRTLPVVTIDGVSFSAAEFEFFFYSEYMDYANMMSQFQGMGGSMPDPNRSLTTQIFNMETGETWADILLDATYARMAHLVSLHNAAKEANFELTAEHYEIIDHDVLRLEAQAITNVPQIPFDTYLQRMYGNSMNESVYRKLQEFIAVAMFYSEDVRDSFQLTQNDLDAYYAERKDELDVFNYRMFILGSAAFMEEDYETDEDRDAARVIATEQAHTRAAEIAATITSEDDFINAARDFGEFYDDPESTLRMMQAQRLDEDTRIWLQDSARKPGDVTVINTEHGGNIMYFISHDDNSYNMASMRQILFSRPFINPESYPEGELDSDYLAALELADAELQERAETVFAKFKEAGATEEALIELMGEHSDDTTQGGFYSDISKFPYQGTNISTMKVVAEIEEWLFADNRAVSDYELIYTKDFGYHLIYFPGFGEQFSRIMADDMLRTEKHSEWLESLPVGQPVKHAAFMLVRL